MRAGLTDLLHLLELERIEDNIFRGESRDIGSSRVFGGQVLGQALTAASYTVEGRDVHSLHAYFLRAGDVDTPIVYDVDRGARRQELQQSTGRCDPARPPDLQHDGFVSDSRAGYRAPGTDARRAGDPMNWPTSARSWPGSRRGFRTGCADTSATIGRSRFGPSIRSRSLMPQTSDPIAHLWLRASDALPADPGLHRNLLAYLSDYQLVATATLPHGIRFMQGSVQLASLDHAIWFSSAVPSRRVVALCDGEPERGGCPRARVRPLLLPRRRTGRVDGAGRTRQDPGLSLAPVAPSERILGHAILDRSGITPIASLRSGGCQLGWNRHWATVTRASNLPTAAWCSSSPFVLPAQPICGTVRTSNESGKKDVRRRGAD